MMKNNKKNSPFIQDMQRNWNTFKSLRGKSKLAFVWDYYRWRIIVIAFSIMTICTFANLLYEGQKPCRLRACVVLNTEDNCRSWFDKFTKELKADGKPGKVDINLDQPFDYDNKYYYIQELEVMTTISSFRMDIAVCGKDMYSYLLALNACMPLDKALPKDLTDSLSDSKKLVYDTANLKIDENGKVNPKDGIDGYYAVDLSGTEFYNLYNQTEDGKEPLYAVIISNTEHLEDSIKLLRALLKS